MILRLFATDGFTPERVFRWSVEETAAHLCQKQLLWVTRLDGPYKPLVDWFVKQPSFAGVCLDPSDKWEWNREHEVTYRLAQSLYFGETPPEAVCWKHDDMAPPECSGFKEYVEGWLDSQSTTMAAPAYQLWDGFDRIRVDKVGMDFAGSIHCWLAKWRPSLRWLYKPGEPYTECQTDERFYPFRPLNTYEIRNSPWPFRHAKGVDRSFREHQGFTRRGFPTDRWKNADGVKCVPYRADETWEEFKARVGRSAKYQS